MAYNALNNLIDAYIYANGVQAITGQILNGVLKQMVSQLGSGYHLMGVAGPGTAPEQNDFAMAYFAATAGEYTDFGGITLSAGEVAVLLTYGNGSWEKRTIYTVPTTTEDLENTAGFITNAVTDLVNYYTKTEVDTTLADYPTLEALATALADYYTKQEVDTTLDDYATKDGVDETLEDYYTKDEMDTALGDRYTKQETDTKLGDYYRKTETYDKDEVDSIVAALSRQEYIVAWDGLAVPDVSAIPAGVTVTYNATPYTGTLAASASTVNKIYMVWNGVAYDMYGTSQDGGYSWVPMGTTTVDLSQYATKAELSQLQQKVTDLYGEYVEDSNFIRVVTDNDGRILYGVKADGDFYFGAGVPQQVKDYIEQNTDITMSEVEALITASAETKVDKEEGKSLIDSGVASSENSIANSEFLDVVTDQDGRICEGITKDGNKRIDIPVDTPTFKVSHIEEDEYLSVVTDEDSRIVCAIKKDGTAIYGGVNVTELKERIEDDGIKFAHNYGILPTNTASKNAELMNGILQGGNIDIVFSIPGTYKIGYSVKIGSNTTITCKEGVIFEREGTFFNVFINSGASTATYNERITLDGFYLNVPQEGIEVFDFDSPTMGLRGLMAFAFVRELTIKNLIIRSVDDFQYMLHINKAERVVIEHFDIRGEKDGIHLSSLYDFVIRDGVFQTTDDAIGLNGYDLYDNNLVGGDVKYGVIENISSIKRPTIRGCGIRMMVGAFVNWYDGIEVMDCEMVRGTNGRIYRVIALPDYNAATKQTFISHTSPTITTYTGKQADNGFYWKLVDSNPMMSYNSTTGVTRVDVSDIVIRNFKVNQGAYVVMQDVWYDGYSNIFRTLHPDVLPSDYPHTDNILLENIVNHGSASPDLVDINPYVITDAKFSNIFGFMRRFIAEDGGAKKRMIFENYDFTKVIPNSDIDIEAGENSEIVIRDCKTTRSGGNLVISSQGSVKSNCSISSLPGNPKKGDTLILDGVFKYYNGEQWV